MIKFHATIHFIYLSKIDNIIEEFKVLGVTEINNNRAIKYGIITGMIDKHMFPVLKDIYYIKGVEEDKGKSI